MKAIFTFFCFSLILPATAQSSLIIQQQVSPSSAYQQRQFQAELNLIHAQQLSEVSRQQLELAQQQQAEKQAHMRACATQVRTIWQQRQYPTVMADGVYKVHFVVEGNNCEVMSVRVQNNLVVPAYTLKENDAILPITSGRGIVMMGNGPGQPSTQLELYFIY